MSEQQVRDLRFVASVRNTVVHEAAELTDDKRARLREITDEFLAAPLGGGGRSHSRGKSVGLAVVALTVIAAYLIFG